MPRKRKNLPTVADQEEGSKVGRSSKLTDEKIEEISRLLSIGGYIDIASAFAGISPRTAQFWIARGKAEPGSIYAKFLDKVRESLAKAEMRDLAVIDLVAQGRPAKYKERPARDENGKVLYDAKGQVIMELDKDGNGNPILLLSEIKPNWQGAAWKMERRSPHRWGRFDRILIDDLTKINEEIDVTKSTDKEKAEVKTPLEEREKKALAIMSKLKDLEDLDDL